MYILPYDNAPLQRLYITDTFRTNPILYVSGGETLAKQLLLKKEFSKYDDHNNNDDIRKNLNLDHLDLVQQRFKLIEAPKSRVTDLMGNLRNVVEGTSTSPYAGTGELPGIYEELNDVDANGGTLVLFDSVSLPHEVMVTKGRDRWACSGWMHEDQQPVQHDTIVNDTLS
mmetsp:Transcript_7395/g.10584  ORF Transcript_7395/g.10584 Transcript_7395/m.10584 type:complete len:170 (+) Transcript_7395:418-927(+)